MARPGSIPDIERDTFPPPPSSHSVEDRLTWTENALRVLRSHPGRMRALEESLGEEGSAAKGIPSTGLHLALEHARAELREELAAVLQAVQGVAANVQTVTAGLAADRAERAQREGIEAAKRAAIDEVRAPGKAVWTTARTALVTGLVTLLLGGLAARVYVGWREPPTVTAPR